jgi:hypothetical protein
VLVDDPAGDAPRVEGTLDIVARGLVRRLEVDSRDLPFDDRAARLLTAALEAAERHQTTLLPMRKRRALEEAQVVLEGYARKAKQAGDRPRRELVAQILELLDGAARGVDLNRLAEGWLDLVRREWYAHLTDPRSPRPGRLRNLRKRLRQEPISTERLKAITTLDLTALPIERRVVAAVIGLPPFTPDPGSC